MKSGPVPIPRLDPSAPSPGDSLVAAPTLASGDFGRRVARLLMLRTIVVSVVLALSLWVLVTGDDTPRAAVWLQSGMIAMTYASSILFGLLLRSGFTARRISRPMHVGDLLITSLLVYVTGGVTSPYVFLYALSIVGASTLSYRRGAVVLTMASMAAVTVTSLLAWGQALELPMSTQSQPWLQSGGAIVRSLGINYAALIGVGALSYIFGDQLERGAETLATTRKAVADLYTLHQDIVRSLPSGLITTAPDGIILTANAAAGEILRRPHAQLISASIETVMPGLTAQLVQGELRRGDLALEAGSDTLTLGISVSPLRDVRDQVIGRVVNFTDLTELRRLEQQGRRTERLATVGQLAAGIAHEIRNPLASISGSIELLRATPQASDDDRTLMAIVHREITRLNGLIGDLLDFANPRPAIRHDADLGLVLEETVQVARADQAFADIELVVRISGPLRCHVDSGKIRQVLWNLLRNAADAAAAGGRHVSVSGSATAREVSISVEDDGPGIPPDHLGRVFDPFYTTKSKGTGLGLATCHAIVSEHGGRIDVDSTVGRGTKMVVRIPTKALP